LFKAILVGLRVNQENPSFDQSIQQVDGVRLSLESDETDVLAALPLSKSYGFYFFILAGVLGLTAVYIPYRTFNLHPIVFWSVGFSVGILSLYFSLSNFTLLLAMFTVFAPFQKVMPGDFGGMVRAFNLTNIFLIFMIFGWITQAQSKRTPFLRFHLVETIIALLVFISGFSFIQGYYSFGSASWKNEHLIFPLKRWIEPMLIYMIFVNNLPDRKSITKICTAILITIFFCTLITLKQFYLDKGGFGGSFSSLDKMRVNGIAAQPNQMAAFFCYYAFYYLAFFFVYWRRLPAWAFILLYLFAYQGMHLCFSRGGQLGFLAGTLMTIWLWSKRLFFLLIVPLILICLSIPQIIPQRFIGRMNTVFQHHEIEPFSGEEARLLDVSAHSRIVIWKGALSMIQDYPVFGVGFGRFKDHIGDYIPKGTTAFESHSTYLSIACEMGVFALVIFLALMIVLYFKARYVYLHSEIAYFRALALGYMGGWYGLMIANVFGSRLDSNEVTFFFWIMSAVIIRLGDLTKIEIERRKPAAEQNLEPIPSML